jgi:hypothetical protein
VKKIAQSFGEFLNVASGGYNEKEKLHPDEFVNH